MKMVLAMLIVSIFGKIILKFLIAPPFLVQLEKKKLHVPKTNIATFELQSLSSLNDVTFLQFTLLGHNLEKKMESELVLLSTFCLP
jgi:hypothetical protein